MSRILKEQGYIRDFAPAPARVGEAIKIRLKYTEDRRPNFDIYLPVWIAKYNKEVFGPLFVGGTLFTVARWAGWLG